ncbi:MFS transporter [Kitasatospora purpeofusca]|uniref:MFS transporter n=1 Tax=Kitasatospora purpeofusca TaxID=67352 RepID=UPI0035E2AF0B
MRRRSHHRGRAAADPAALGGPARHTPPALALAHPLFAAGLIGLALTCTLPALIASVAVKSLGNLLVMGRIYALVTDLAPPGASGRYLAVFGTSWGVAGTLAPVLGTQLLAHAGTTALWSAMAAFCALLAAPHLRVTPEAPRPPQPPAPEEYGSTEPAAAPGPRR